ncbi:MAG: hypothetical protein PUK40_07025 [Actinomycetaceae bacterium]|nr:hypothetical protein [Arcanobacterium sp.]MDD7505672.1 hypothetical protein [Actinomycetaceae bacterium]MDY6143457.1 hypothetical protein [Arcanobacterium sp.]
MRFVWGVLACIIGAAAVVLLVPSAFPMLKPYFLTTPLAQLLAVRTALAIGLAVLAIVLIFVALLRRILANRGRIAGALGALLMVVALLHGGITLSRGIDSAPTMHDDAGVTENSAGNGAITVMNYNTLGGQTTPEQIARLVIENGVDVVSLPETSTQRGREVVQALGRSGLSFQQFDTDTSVYAAEFQSTVLLISQALGTYNKVAVGDFPASVVVAEPVSPGAPTFIGTHPIAPVPRLIDQWREAQAAVYGLCGEYDNAIISGDFNSTVDHQALFGGTCKDAAIEARGGSLGTWPAALASVLSVPIDRVLHTGAFYQGESATVVNVGDSDHRGIIVRLTPSAS